MPSSLDASPAPASAESRALDLLRGRPNPFENLVRPQRPDDRFIDLHVPALLREPRELLLRIIDTYRLPEYRGPADLPDTRVVTVQGIRGSGKTHMLEALVHRDDLKPQLLVRPTYYEPQAPFNDYLLAQLVIALLVEDPLLGGKPFVAVAAQLTRRLLRQALRALGPTDRLFAGGPAGWQRFWLLWGGGEVLAARTERLSADLADRTSPKDVRGLVLQHGFSPDLLMRLIEAHLLRHESGDEVLFAIRRQLYLAMARATLLQDGDALNRFLETDYTPANARPFFRGDVVKQLLHVLIEACALVQLPIVFALDNLEGFLAPQSRFDPQTTRAFMDSLAQAVDATRGLLFLIFAETTLHRQILSHTHPFALDRLHQGVPLRGQGPVDLIDLRPPSFEDLQPLIAERMGRLLRDFPEADQLPAGFPYRSEFLVTFASRKDMGLRAKLLLLRDEYSRVVYGRSVPAPVEVKPPEPDWKLLLERAWSEKLSAAASRLQDAPANQLQPLHAGLGRLLQLAGSPEQGDWQLTEVQPTVTVGESTAYGVVTLIQWQPAEDGSAAGDGSRAPVRVAVGLLLGRGPGLAKDLKAKFDVFQDRTLAVDSLIVLWPRAVDGEPVDALPQATREVWKGSRRRKQAVLRTITDDDLRKMLAVPEWLDAVQSAADQPVPEEVLRSFVRQRGQSVFPLLLPAVLERTTTHAD